MNYTDLDIEVNSPEYERNFWNAMRGRTRTDAIEKGKARNIGTYHIPTATEKEIETQIDKHSVMREICTVVDFYETSGKYLEPECEDGAAFLDEFEAYPVTELEDDFTKHNIQYHKLGSIVKVSADFCRDVTFNFAKYLARRTGRVLGRAEDDAVINGDSTKTFKGILGTNGADSTVTTKAISYDDVIALYFSVKPEFRKNGTWLMNDETALALKKLKDADGAPLWSGSDDTLLGHKVCISEFMPGIASGGKPIAFGDFSYYWIIRRSRITVKPLLELFSLNDIIGYSFMRFIDGLLIKHDAIKVLEIE